MVEKTTLRKWSSIGGALMINFLSRPVIYWGIMAVYVMSYRVYLGRAGTLINNVWFYVFYNSGWSICMLSMDALTRWVRPKYPIVLGILVFNSFFFGSAFSDGMSWTSYMCLFSFVVGSGLGLFESLVLKYYVVEWAADDDKGILTSLYVTSSSAGAAVANQFMTLWTNPQNLSPDLQLGNFVLFSYDEVCQRVPSMFLMMGAASVTLQFIGFCLLRDRPQSPITPDTDDVHRLTPPSKNPKYNSIECDTENGIRESRNILSNSNGETNLTGNIIDISADQNSNEEKDGTILQFISKRDFQRLFFIFYALAHVLEITASFYKVYGSLWIKNDFFFSTLGTMMVVPGIFSNVIIGRCLDKFGLRLCFMVLCALLSLLSLLMYFSAMLNPVFYFVVTTFAYTFSSGMYSCVTASTVILFGSKHLSRNLALVSSATIFSGITASSVSEFILSHNYDWFWVFAWAASLSALALIVATRSFGQNGKESLKR